MRMLLLNKYQSVDGITVKQQQQLELLTRQQGHNPNEGDGTDCSLIGGHVPQGIANGIPAVNRDECERQHGHCN